MLSAFLMPQRPFSSIQRHWQRGKEQDIFAGKEIERDRAR